MGLTCPMPNRTPLLLHAALSAGLVGLAACGGSAELGLLIRLANVPARSARIVASGSLDGAAAVIDQAELPAGGLTRFGITVPAQATGTLRIALQAQDSDGCTQGTSTLETSLPAPRGSELVATLTTVSPRRCQALAPCPSGSVCTLAKAQSKRLWSSWATSGSDAWMVGNAGTVLHWDGQTWSPRSTGIPNDVDLNGVWASGQDDAWAVGVNSSRSVGFIFHFTGASWTLSHTGPRGVSAIHGTSRDDIFAVGAASGAGQGELRRWNRSSVTWDAVPVGSARELISVWASSPQEVWAVGLMGTWLRFDGSTVTPVSGAAGTSLYAIHGYRTSSQQTVVYAVGASGVVLRHDGSPHLTSSGTQDNNGVLATPEAVYVASTSGIVSRSPGTSDAFAPLPSVSALDLSGIHLAPNGIAWIVGDAGFQGYLDTRP